MQVPVESKTEEAEVREKLLAGDQRGAVALLYRRHAARLVQRVRPHLRTPQDADDLVEGLFVDLCASIGAIDIQRSWRAWLNGASHLRVAKFYERQRSERKALDQMVQGAPEPCAPPTPEAEVEQAERVRQAWHIVGLLSSAERLLAHIYYHQCLTREEVAERLNITRDTLRQRLSRFTQNAAALLVARHLKRADPT